MDMRTMRDVGLRVRELRLRNGWTQAEFADRLGASRAWVVRLEQGAPRLEAQRVLDALVVLGSPLVAIDGQESARTAGPDDPFAVVFEALR